MKLPQSLLLISMTVFSLVSFSASAGHDHDENYEGEDGDLSFVNPLAEGDNWMKMVTRFGGKVRSASRYPNNASGFQQFMLDSGVTEYSAAEIITPGTPELAEKCGIKYLLPSQNLWMRAAGIALWGQALAVVAGEKPNIISWYREPCYNKGVGGATSSDHMTARSMDLDFSSVQARRKAQAWLCQFWKTSLNMQIGLGGSVIHLGAESPRGKRNWYYDTYADKDQGKTCFDK